jgi:hypothetical protein
MPDWAMRLAAALHLRGEVQEDARAHARDALRGHRGVLRSLTREQRAAIALMGGSEDVGRVDEHAENRQHA